MLGKEEGGRRGVQGASGPKTESGKGSRLREASSTSPGGPHLAPGTTVT